MIELRKEFGYYLKKADSRKELHLSNIPQTSSVGSDDSDGGSQKMSRGRMLKPQLSSKQSRSASGSVGSRQEKRYLHSKTLTEEQLPLLDALAKITILTIGALLSTMIVLFIYNFAWSETNLKEFQYWVDSMLINWDSFINSLCIYLSFAQNKKFYDKICHSCHNSCVFKCDAIAQWFATKSLMSMSRERYELYMKYANEMNIRKQSSVNVN